MSLTIKNLLGAASASVKRVSVDEAPALRPLTRLAVLTRHSVHAPGRWIAHLGAVLLAAACVFGNSPVRAQALGEDAVRELALQGMWAAEKDWGYWRWSEDNSVCLRVYSPDGDCTDKGTWNVNGEVLCYELEWWGETYDVRKNCFTVQPLDEGRYETLLHGATLKSTFIIFQVVE